MNLTFQQQEAMQHIIEFLETPQQQVFILRGYAGTGKTTMLASVVEYLHGLMREVCVMAPTGRAAKVLRAKIPSCGATTIHRAIYSFTRVYCNSMNDSVKYVFPLREDEEKTVVDKNGNKVKAKKDDTVNAKPIYIVDEASMIATGASNNVMFQYGTGFLMDDILEKAQVRHGGKIIFVGDPMQLPPVGEEDSLALEPDFFRGMGLNVMEYELTDVVRQERNSVILANAMMCRNAIKWSGIGRLDFDRKEGEVVDICANDVAKAYCNGEPGSSAIICWSNKQAARYNNAVRDILFPDLKHIRVGDLLMVVSNNYMYNEEIMNGDMIRVTSIEGAPETQITSIWSRVDDIPQQVDVPLTFRRIEFETEDGRRITRNIIESLLYSDMPSLSIDEKRALFFSMRSRVREAIGRTNETSPEYIDAVMNDEYYNALQVKYGYAFTCHKSQGGEWSNVYVDMSGRTRWDHETLRWNYTAITRARDTLWLINGKVENPLANMIINATRKMSKCPKDMLACLDYTPSVSSLRELKNMMNRVCKDADVEIKGVIEGQYRVAYYLRTSGKYSNIAFTFDKAGNITTATPASDIIDEDEKLNDVISSIMDYIMEKCV